ncbi:hypothetical protein IGI04_027454 [Brassica rapa subsp. trilocularis]|uniref:Late embryogenesis abundant protein LEA-2 subgroup domain-containing protein n=1 Tax=Brassica rapa subsp. trilocularis TaxID=1813537 RepID=A0ABQ7KZ18_BRACM|nr:hypothetical protein IGI04_027454 [Brassica rapa subsp. trilocularis]
MNTDDKKEKAGAPMLAAEAPKSNADMETQSPNGSGKKRNRKIYICVSLLILLLLIFIVLLVLGLTLFKPKNPTATVDSVVVERLRTSVDVLNLKANLNLTLQAHLALKNPNRVGFSFGSTSALLNYKGQLVGEAPLPANKVGPQKTLHMNVTLTLMADRLLSESQVFSDVMSGSIPVNAFVKVAGKVSVFNMFKIKVKSSASCDVTISVSSRNVTSQHCKYSTKLLNVTPNGALLHGFLYQHRSSNPYFIIALTLALKLENSDPICSFTRHRLEY